MKCHKFWPTGICMALNVVEVRILYSHKVIRETRDWLLMPGDRWKNTVRVIGERTLLSVLDLKWLSGMGNGTRELPVAMDSLNYLTNSITNSFQNMKYNAISQIQIVFLQYFSRLNSERRPDRSHRWISARCRHFYRLHCHRFVHSHPPQKTVQAVRKTWRWRYYTHSVVQK